MAMEKVDTFRVHDEGEGVRDFGTFARFITRKGDASGLGKRVRVQFPTLTGLRVRGTRKSRTLGRRGVAFLYQRDPQFVLVLALTLKGRQVHHDSLIERSEKGFRGTDWYLHGLGEQVVYLNEGKGRLRMGFADLRASVMQSMWELVGPPEEEGSWLAGKLLPRRIPAAARLVDGRHLQLWSFL
jgi:hypothetical protein